MEKDEARGSAVDFCENCVLRSRKGVSTFGGMVEWNTGME